MLEAKQVDSRRCVDQQDPDRHQAHELVLARPPNERDFLANARIPEASDQHYSFERSEIRRRTSLPSISVQGRNNLLHPIALILTHRMARDGVSADLHILEH